MKQEIRFCTTWDGAKLAYAISGEGPPLVMSATWLTHLEYQWRSLAWKPWLEALSRQYTLVRYDSRGCGLSDRQVRSVSFETWVQDFESVINASGFKRFALLGTCQGGPIALEYAARHPKRVSHLILYGTYTRGRAKRLDRPEELEKARLLIDLTRLGWGQDNHAFLQAWALQFQPGGTLEHIRSWAEQQRAATSAEMAVELLRIGWEADVSGRASQIACPVLVAHPERDAVVPIEEGRMLARQIPNCRFVQLDSDNHMPLADEPAFKQFLEEVHSFLTEAEVTLAPANTLLPIGTLTIRERDVLDAIAAGLDNAEIAKILGLSEKTVRNHITRVFDKIGVEHRYQAIVRAREAGLGVAREDTNAALAGTNVPSRRSPRRLRRRA